MTTDLERRIRWYAAEWQPEMDTAAAEAAFGDLLDALDRGEVRAAERESDGRWIANAWVKEGILLGFRLGRLTDRSVGPLPFFDKHTYPVKSLALSDGVRLVPGGSAVRAGSYLASGVVCMPPMYVNTGAFIDEGTMIDSHALVGSCAQIGKRVHLSAAAQIGGVIEPVGALPVIVEDDVFIGGGAGVYEGTIVRRGAVLASGIVLTGSTRIFDLVHATTIEAGEVPEMAVVVPGSRAVTSEYGRALGLGVYAPIIVKYRDEKTEAAVALEAALR